ncbi:hypothetical protein [Butyrivibrio sp. NC2007]|uniref:hypothetical protein n=1 Tax=Butyrivibrio sp. NC2007 TaxID=1280683 RepID=UPI0003B771F0|nr:hypothetical protein [Butyrivibrio sp. NC2007]
MDKKILLYNKPVIVNDALWVSSLNDNGLYRISNDNCQCEFIRMFPNESFSRGYLHSSSVRYGNELFFVPFAGRYISSYCLDDGSMKCYKLDHYSDGMSSLFYTCVVEGDFLYLIPCRYEYIVEFNMKTSEINEYKIFDLAGKKQDEMDPFVLRGGCLGDGKIYLGENTRNRIIEFDINTKGLKEYVLEHDVCGISNLLYLNGEMWILGKNGSILYGDINKGEFVPLVGTEICEAGHHGTYLDTLIDKKDIYVTKTSGRTIFKIDSEEKTILKIVFGENHMGKSDFCPFDLLALYKTNGEIRALDSFNGMIYRYDCLNDKVLDEKFPCMTYEDIDYRKCRKEKKEISLGNVTRKGIELSTFLQCIHEGQYDQSITYEGMNGKSVLLYEGK